MISIKFPDDSIKKYPKGISPIEIAMGIGEKFSKKFICAKFNNEPIDLKKPLEQDGTLIFLDFNDPSAKKAFWHTSSHILAQAVKRLYPNALPAIGPSIEEGFYYDFDNLKISEEDFLKIEKEMQKIVSENLEIIHHHLEKKELSKLFKEEKYKLEILNEIEDKKISIYTQGDYVEICRGPHLPSTGFVKAIKLTKLAGAYWKGDCANPMLTRIYGISFPEEKLLKEYLALIEEAKKRDHKKIGIEMELFDIKEEGPGFPFFLPKGVLLWNALMEFWREEHRIAGYQEIKTPIILSRALWEKSGHWDHYKNNMYFTKIDDADYAVKPMNCPGGILVYSGKKHSYKEFPLRIAEVGLVHRHELSGVLNGLFRVRCFNQDDAHLFVTPTQLENEVIGVINLVDKFYKTFGFEYKVEVSTRPKNSIGSDEAWDKATKALMNALDKLKTPYKINEGDGAFYGPKIDFHVFDSLKRTWQCATVQVDFSMPERFDLKYMGEDGTENHRPIMIHRVIYGSLERFIGIITEHFAGKFPMWLAPTQVKVISVSESFNDYAEKVYTELFNNKIRVEKDIRSETIGKKIRESHLQRVKYLLIVGEEEQKNKMVNIRNTYENKVMGSVLLSDFTKMLLDEIKQKKM